MPGPSRRVVEDIFAQGRDEARKEPVGKTSQGTLVAVAARASPSRASDRTGRCAHLIAPSDGPHRVVDCCSRAEKVLRVLRGGQPFRAVTEQTFDYEAHAPTKCSPRRPNAGSPAESVGWNTHNQFARIRRGGGAKRNSHARISRASPPTLEHRFGDIAETELVPQPQETAGSTTSVPRGYGPGQPETSYALLSSAPPVFPAIAMLNRARQQRCSMPPSSASTLACSKSAIELNA